MIFEVDGLRPPLQSAERVLSQIVEVEADGREPLGRLSEQIRDDALAKALVDREHPLQALLRFDQDVVMVGPFETDGMLTDTNHYYFVASGHQPWVTTQKPRLDALTVGVPDSASAACCCSDSGYMGERIRRQSMVFSGAQICCVKRGRSQRGPRGVVRRWIKCERGKLGAR
jgi:hypothetical protein